MENESLFSEFQPVSTKQWKQKIQYDLKGADYNDALVWESLEGIKVKPFYNSEDLEGLPSFSLPKAHQFAISQGIYTGNPSIANKKALEVLSKGIESLVFTVPDSSIDWEKLLNGIPLKETRIHLQLDFLELDPIKKLLGYVKDKKAKIHLNIDILGNLAKSGNWFHNQEKDHEILDEIHKLSKSEDDTSIFSIDTGLYQNAGANMVQQLAYGLAQANEYLNHLVSNAKKSVDFTFKVAIGGNYFFEIAKIRALRWLWQSLAKEYEIVNDCHILAYPSIRNKTIYDYNVNMLRTSTECMAAILGGADTICNLPYDYIYNKENEFGERIARNQLLLLKEESYFNEAIHAAEGNYYIAKLTHQLSEKALALFKQIEVSGGFLKLLSEGTIQRKIRESEEKEQMLFENGEMVLVGSNKYENRLEQVKNNLELYPFIKTDKRQTLVEPIIKRRLAERLEQKRLQDE